MRDVDVAVHDVEVERKRAATPRQEGGHERPNSQVARRVAGEHRVDPDDAAARRSAG